MRLRLRLPTGTRRGGIFCLAFFAALLTGQTVCLNRLASLFPSKAKIESRYQRIRRFFGGFTFDCSDFAQVVLRLAQKAGARPPFVLAFDRTECLHILVKWQLGKTPINVFLIGIVRERVVFPLLWLMLEKEGCSNTSERIELFEQAVALLGKEQIDFFVGDREFLSAGLLDWLCQKQMGYRLRVRQDILLTNGHGEAVTAGWLFRRGALGPGAGAGRQARVFGTRSVHREDALQEREGQDRVPYRRKR